MVASKVTPNARNLQALGSERLAELLVEQCKGDDALKRRLRLELAAKQKGELAKEVRKRLISIGRSRAFIDWRKVRTFSNELELQRRLIVEDVAKTDPAQALELLWSGLV